MPKYNEYSARRSAHDDRPKIHPVWRGVGFLLIILIPVISYAATEVLLQQNGLHNWFPLPVDLLAGPGQILYQIFHDPMINIKAMFFVIILAILYALLTLVSFMANSMFGLTNRNDPFYVPPVQRRRRRK